MIEGHKFVDAYFIDEERKTLDILYFDIQNKTYKNQVIVAEEGDSEWEKFLKPEELISILKKNDLNIDRLDGMKFNILTDSWTVSDDKSINYIAKFIKS